MAVNKQRIQDTLQKMASFGGTDGDGTTRLSYSPVFLWAQDYLEQQMLELGMEVERDAIGNLIGTYAGTEPELKPVMSGSHLDTVPHGGNYDGILGVVSALETARSWHEEGYRPRRSLQVIATVEEESTAFGLGCFGVRVRSGEFKDADPERIACQAEPGTLADKLREAGLPSDALRRAAAGLGGLHAFVELHIEQGAELDENRRSAGIVSHIVGFDRIHFIMKGEANHAGTTAMHRRRDAAAAGAAVILAVQKLARGDRRFVATVGSFSIRPDVPNIVPGRAAFCVETRSYSNEVLREVHDKVFEIVKQAAADNGVEWELENDFHVDAVPLSREIISLMQETAAEQQLDCVVMPSWAGHDSQIFAAAGVPTGMIFVPSVKGVSHSGKEFSRPDEIAAGAALLEQVLRRLTA